MAKEKPEVVFSPKASDSIDKLVIYIEQNGFPITADKFADKIYKFGYSLSVFPNKYPICRFPKLAKRNYRCAVFESNYIFIYKVIRKQLVVFNVIHGKRFVH